MVVTVTATSQYQLTAVHAQAGVVGADLAANPNDWTGTLDISSLPHGMQSLVVTATDAQGSMASTTTPFVHDNPPRLLIEEPVYAPTLSGDGLAAAVVRSRRQTQRAILQVATTTPDTSPRLLVSRTNPERMTP
jgi:hypothetical protein